MPADVVTVRSDLSGYSWGELGKIAAEIEACATREEALSQAIHFNLVDSSGKFGSVTKDVKLSDGKVMHMRLVDVFHDRADTASGRAGLTFLSDGIVIQQTMHTSETIGGGWSASKLRSWMASDMNKLLPQEVSSVIVPVYKLTNNQGATKSTSSVTETLDALWAPSVVELCGPLDWTYQSDPPNSGLYNAVMNAEGSQYAAFSQVAIDNYAPNRVFSLGGDWWVRSPSPKSGRARFVDDEGDPSYYANANELKGVVVGFCL